MCLSQNTDKHGVGFDRATEKEDYCDGHFWASTICLWSEGLEYVLVGVFCSSAIVSKSIRIASFYQWPLTDVWMDMYVQHLDAHALTAYNVVGLVVGH